ncbi:hypothetical protein J6590_002648 [Homalodisca vitripennis]|nr:hypothetical protein J6590_002648 [Homalodisca vitripennis]
MVEQVFTTRYDTVGCRAACKSPRIRTSVATASEQIAAVAVVAVDPDFSRNDNIYFGLTLHCRIGSAGIPANKLIRGVNVPLCPKDKVVPAPTPCDP